MSQNESFSSKKERKKEIDKTFAFFFFERALRELYPKQSDDIYIQKGRRTAAALTENPARALVAVLEVLKLTCSFVRPFVGEGKREASRSARVLCWIGHRKRSTKEDTRPSFFPPFTGRKFKIHTAAPFARARKKGTTTKTRRLRPRVLGRIESREHFRARLRARFRRDGVKKYIPPRSRRRLVVVNVVGGFSARVIHLFVGAEKKRPSLQKNKNEKIHSLYRAFCVGKRSRSRSRDRKRVLGAGANGWGRTLEVSFAEATVDVKENIFVCAVCLSMCFVRKVGKENGRWKKTGEKKNLKRRGFRV